MCDFSSFWLLVISKTLSPCLVLSIGYTAIYQFLLPVTSSIAWAAWFGVQPCRHFSHWQVYGHPSKSSLNDFVQCCCSLIQGLSYFFISSCFVVDHTSLTFPAICLLCTLFLLMKIHNISQFAGDMWCSSNPCMYDRVMHYL